MNSFQLPRHQPEYTLAELEQFLADRLHKHEALKYTTLETIIDQITMAAYDDESGEYLNFIIKSPAWAEKNAARDRNYNPKTSIFRFQKEYRRMVSCYKTSGAAPDGFAWHPILIDQLLQNIFSTLLNSATKIKKLSKSKAMSMTAEIASFVIVFEVRNLQVKFDQDDTRKILNTESYHLKKDFIKKRFARKSK